MKPLIYTQNQRLLKVKQPEPIHHGPATLMGFAHRHPCTVIFFDEKRLIVQEDKMRPDSTYESWTCQRDEKGKLWTFVRRKGSNRWKPSGGEVGIGIAIGRKMYCQDFLTGDLP